MSLYLLQGTFLVRPGLSLAGCMVISAVVPEGPCKHMALDSNQLSLRSLEVSTTQPCSPSWFSAAESLSMTVYATCCAARYKLHQLRSLLSQCKPYPMRVLLCIVPFTLQVVCAHSAAQGRDIATVNLYMICTWTRQQTDTCVGPCLKQSHFKSHI